MKHLFLNNRFFIALGITVIAFATGFAIPFLLPVAWGLLFLTLLLVLIDYLLLFASKVRFRVRRRVPKVFSLGDENKLSIEINNLSKRDFNIEVIDELPIQFQLRDFSEKYFAKQKEPYRLSYALRPLTRGSYGFGKIHLFLKTQIQFLERRISFDREQEVPVFPSIVQMKQYSLRAFDRSTTDTGIKKLRRIGHSYEFEQIKNYVPGDDPRSINWKASSRRAQIMVNQYEDERAQNIYCIIDKSRAMRMPFDGLSLMDYAINTSLAISNIALQKHDRAGLLTFSDKIGATIKADRRSNQLHKILNALYKEKERNLEANYELLYQSARRLIQGRSLLLLFTNFESMFALDRVLPILRRINNLHLLVVVIFKNTEISDFVKSEVNDVEGIYHQTIARQFISDKEAMVRKLKQYGIQAVLTRPENLSVNTINKYLELKAKGLI